MAASMAMCLRALGYETTEDEVNRVMGTRPMHGAAWEQALACAQHFGCRATLTMPATVQQLKAWTDRGVPVMIGWNPEGRPWSHASVVFDVDETGHVSVADPNIPNPTKTVRVVEEDDFYHKWFEKFPDYLVRRPACAIEREITPEGRQVMASTKPMAGIDRVAELYLKRQAKGKKPESQKTKIKIKDEAPAPRDPNAKARAEQIGPKGSGAHQTRTKDVEKGKSRKEKHKKSPLEREAAMAPRAPRGKLVIDLSLGLNEDFEGHDLIDRPSTRFKVVPDLKAARKVLVDYVSETGVGGGNMTATTGFVYDDTGTAVARISYNGRVWQPGRPGQTTPEIKLAAVDPWWPASGGDWKVRDPEVFGDIVLEDTWDSVKDRNIPDSEYFADPELTADGIPELVEQYHSGMEAWRKFTQQGWWPKPIKVQKWHLYVTYRPTRKTFDAWFEKNELPKAKAQGALAIEVIRGRKYPRWMTPMKAATLDIRYRGNPDGAPVGPGVGEHGADQPIGGGFDVMQQLQNERLKDQGRPLRPENTKLARCSSDSRGSVDAVVRRHLDRKGDSR